MHAVLVFLCSLIVSLVAWAGRYILLGLPGSSDYIPSNPHAALTAGVLTVVGVGVASLALIFFSDRDDGIAHAPPIR